MPSIETYEARNVDFAQRLVKQAWGGLDFHVRDPDGNIVSFVQYMRAARQVEKETEA